MAASVLALLGAVLIGTAAYLVLRSRRAPAAVPASAPLEVGSDGFVTIVLPLQDADPQLDATKRLVSDAAARLFARDARVTEVVVHSRAGRELGRAVRTRSQPAAVVADVPLALREPHAPLHAGPSEPVGGGRVVHAPAGVRFSDEVPVHDHRSLAEHLELPAAVRGGMTDADDPVAIVRTILEVSGWPIDVDRNAFRRGDRIVIVLHAPVHTGVDAEALSGAYLRFASSGAQRGVVLTAGVLHLADVRRRESLAPRLRHAGLDGIQRMADAVALGADPLDFVLPPD